MKKIYYLLLTSLFSLAIASCGDTTLSSDLTSQTDSVVTSSSTEEVDEFVDYVSQTKLDLNDGKAYFEAKVLRFVDGDTTHFQPKEGNPPVEWVTGDYLSARYISVDTPESTGKIQIWGKSAALFTRSKLESAKSIIVQSDSDQWLTDTTGERYMSWVWYQPEENADYRLLNLELIQEGLAMLKSASDYSLFTTFSAANLQAMKFKKCVYGNDIDPNWYYGDVQHIDMKELRTHARDYEGVKINVEGVVTYYDPFGHMAYAQHYDDETDTWYGMNFYAGFTTYKPLAAGNELRLVGNVAWYAPDTAHENYGSWQVSGLFYSAMHPEKEGSMEILNTNVEVAPLEIKGKDLVIEKHDVASVDELDEGEDNLLLGNAKREVASLESIYVTMSDLKVNSVYVTSSTDSTSNGAMTLTCTDSEGTTVKVRTSVLRKDDDTLLTKEEVLDKTITVRGIVQKYDGSLQIHVFNLNELEIA